MQNPPPYNTGKVLIGCMYTLPPHVPTYEELWIQSTLLGDSHESEDRFWACICSITIAFIVLFMSVYTP